MQNDPSWGFCFGNVSRRVKKLMCTLLKTGQVKKFPSPIYIFTSFLFCSKSLILWKAWCETVTLDLSFQSPLWAWFSGWTTVCLKTTHPYQKRRLPSPFLLERPGCKVQHRELGRERRMKLGNLQTLGLMTALAFLDPGFISSSSKMSKCCWKL